MKCMIVLNSCYSFLINLEKKFLLIISQKQHSLMNYLEVKLHLLLNVLIVLKLVQIKKSFMILVFHCLVRILSKKNLQLMNVLLIISKKKLLMEDGLVLNVINYPKTLKDVSKLQMLLIFLFFNSKDFKVILLKRKLKNLLLLIWRLT